MLFEATLARHVPRVHYVAIRRLAAFRPDDDGAEQEPLLAEPLGPTFIPTRVTRRVEIV